jgi:ribonuclease VapC
MVIDTSAILAIYFQESGADWARQHIAQSPRVLMSTVNLAEALLRFRDTRPAVADELEARLLASDIDFIAPDVAQASIVARARINYPLNFGDCFAYALAKTQNLPLLTLDRDFRAVDLPLILPPE